MSSTKEIRTKVKSIQSTQKITRAMEMVAASKMRRAQDTMAASRPYSEKMKNVAAHLSEANPEYQHVYLQKREVKKVGIIIVSTDRGLCGGLNVNLFRKVINKLRELEDSGVAACLTIMGAKGDAFFKRFSAEILAVKSNIGEKPRVADLVGGVKVMLDAYKKGEITELYVAYNEFVNTMTQKPQINQLLPLLNLEETDKQNKKYGWDYIYEPDAKVLLEQLLTRYIETLVYQSVVDNIACEQASRMVAMKSASDNAGDLIDELKLIYNKARQAVITQELSEIVAGAAAV